MRPKFFALLFVIWAIIAVAVGASGRLATVRGPFVPGTAFLMALVCIVSYSRNQPFRQWINGIGPRALIGLHLVRFVGVYFLLLYHQGRLPYAFAVPGGVGDIIAAVGASALLFIPYGVVFRRTLVLWNSFGMIDLLFVVASAARLNMARPGSMIELTHLPLSLLPTLIVPVIIFTHVVLFGYLRLETISSD